MAYRAFLPAAVPQVRRLTGITDAASVARSYDVTREGLDFVAQNAGQDGYLVGGRFTVADLAAAALLALTIDTGHPAMRLPDPRPAEYHEWLATWASHGGTTWVRSMYDRHRPQSCAA